jgi:hypothetical protein
MLFKALAIISLLDNLSSGGAKAALACSNAIDD